MIQSYLITLGNQVSNSQIIIYQWNLYWLIILRSLSIRESTRFVLNYEEQDVHLSLSEMENEENERKERECAEECMKKITKM